MGKVYAQISPELADWIGQQQMFFVATAPLDGEGHINCSPKGCDTLRIIGPQRVAYLDLLGSGSETITHVRENGRLVIMFCAYDDVPKIVRLHGTARVITPETEQWRELLPHFSLLPGARSIVDLALSRISDSCGFGVPRYEFLGARKSPAKWSPHKSATGAM